MSRSSKICACVASHPCVRYTGEHPCTMSSVQHVFVPVSVADGGLPCTDPPPVQTGPECIPSATREIVSGYVCGSVCADGTMPVSVYQCKNGHWPETANCIDTTEAMLCTADESKDVGTGIAGLTGDGCGSLTAVGTKCEIICQDGYWGTGEIQCSANARARRQLRLPSSSAGEDAEAQAEAQAVRSAEPSAPRKAAAAAREAARARQNRSTEISALEMPQRRLLSGRAGPDALVDADGDELALMLDQGGLGDDGDDSHRRQLAFGTECYSTSKKISVYDANQIGNGVCNTKITGFSFDLNCAQYNWDGGDCPESAFGRDCANMAYIGGTAPCVLAAV
jgi:hypothetical protein